MANKKITQLSVNTNPSGSDVFPIVNGGETKQLTLSGLTAYLEPFLASDYVFTGGTVSGSTTFTNGVNTNSISATTYLNLPVTQFTGGTVNGLTATTISATTYLNLPSSTFTGGTINGLTATTISATTYLNLPVTQFTGGTVNGLTATTISATTYQNLPINLSDLGFVVTPVTQVINYNITLPENSNVTYPSPLIMGVGYTLTVPVTTTLTII